MPPLDEGSILYMPSTMPGISITEAQKLLQATDRILKQFPEVDRVLGKAGRAETSTDPAPLSMLETVIILRPKAEWRPVDTWYSSWAPEWGKAILRRIHSGSHFPGTADQRDERRPAASRTGQWLDDAGQRAHRYAHYRHPHSRRA